MKKATHKTARRSAKKAVVQATSGSPARNDPSGKTRQPGKRTASRAAGRSKQEQREATRRLLMNIAREEFSRHGFAGASTEKIVERAQVTRGALYHQFKDKQDLFRAVFEEAQADIVNAIGAAVETSEDGWDALVKGCRAFLAATTGPGLVQIVMLDGPAVLGLAEWRRLDSEYSYQELKIGIGEVMRAGMLPELPLDSLAVMLSGAMNEAALYCANAANPARALKESQATIVEILEALRARAT
jgi:AcrR family transcriptional regulator